MKGFRRVSLNQGSAGDLELGQGAGRPWPPRTTPGANGAFRAVDGGEREGSAFLAPPRRFCWLSSAAHSCTRQTTRTCLPHGTPFSCQPLHLCRPDVGGASIVASSLDHPAPAPASLYDECLSLRGRWASDPAPASFALVMLRSTAVLRSITSTTVPPHARMSEMTLN